MLIYLRVFVLAVISICAFPFLLCSNLGSLTKPQPKAPCALLLVVEGSANPNTALWDLLWEQKGDSAIYVLAKLLETEPKLLSGLSFEEILDDYGEPFIINSLTSIGKKGYDSIVTLTDSQATFEKFADCVEMLSHSYEVDVVADLHGDSTGWLFYDGFYWFDDFTQNVKFKANIRTLYQTTCNGRHLIDEWESLGVGAVNGAIGTNNFIINSPGTFLTRWVEGASFNSAVMDAYRYELDFFRAFFRENGFPLWLEGYLATGGEQVVGGQDTSITIFDSSKEQ